MLHVLKRVLSASNEITADAAAAANIGRSAARAIIGHRSAGSRVYAKGASIECTDKPPH
jgi:hypothetical protein